MEKNNETNVSRWVNNRLRRAALSTHVDWQPNAQRAFAQFLNKRDAEHRRVRRRTWIVSGVTAIICLVLVFPVTRSFAERWASACVHLLGNLSNAAPSLVYSRPEDRKVAPDFSLNNAPGGPVKLSDFRGKVVLLNFWGFDCAACRVETPWFTEFQQTYRDRGFAVLTVSPDDDPGGDIARLFGGPASIPTTLILDKSGRIAVTHIGLCTKKEYEDAINGLLNEP